MATVLQPSITSLNRSLSKPSVFNRFIVWCKNQQPNSLLWLGITIVAHGCIITPITVSVVIFAGSNLFLFMTAIISMSLAVVFNLATMPTKITIPIFFLSILLDIAIIIASLSSGLSISNVF